MSLQDSLFAEDVECDVTLFARDRRRKRVLVFPPVNNYRRFIIHQLVQDHFADLLHTFSIGQGLDRRTVVCFKSDVIRDPKLNGAECKSGTATSTTDSFCGMDVEGQRSPSASPEHADPRGEGSYSGCHIVNPYEEALKKLKLASIDCLNYVPDVGARPPAARRARNGGRNPQHQPVHQNHAQDQHQQPLPPVTDSSAFAKDPKLNGAECKSGTATSTTDSFCGKDVEGQRSPSASPEHADPRGEGSYSGCHTVNRYEEELKELKLASINCLNYVPAVGARPPAARGARNGGRNPQHQPVHQNHAQDQHQQLLPPVTDSSAFAKSSRQRRPDRAVYVPRHRRSLPKKGSPQPSTDNNRTSGGTYHCVTSSGTSKVPANFSPKEADSTIQQSAESLKERDAKESQSNAEYDVGEGNAKESTQSGVQPNLDVPSGMQCSHDLSNSLTDGKTTDESEDVPNIVDKGELDESVMCEGKSKEPEMVCAEKNEISSESSIDRCTRLIDKPVRLDERTETTDDVITLTMMTSDETKNETLNESTNHDDVPSVIPAAKAEKSNEHHSNRNEAINNKNKRLVRQNMVSEVLIISDSAREKKKQTKDVPALPMTPPEKKVKKIERPKSKPAPPPSPPMKINREECDWDSLFDDNGDCLDPTLIEELTSAVGEVTIEQPKNDYKAYSKQIEVSSDEFAHVVEIYNFPSDFKTSDLAAVFSPFKNGGFELKWVDDTHCLGVFSSPLIAAEVLASDHPFVKTRSLSDATTLSKTKARRSAEFLQPYRSRPETCSALARRLVTGALGVRLATARQEREHEKNVLREAKEKRRLANKQREDAWEGIIPEK